MKLLVERDVFDSFPETLIGVLVARGVDNRTRSDEVAALERMLAEARASALAALGEKSVTEHPRVACWREAYRAFGAKPKKYPSSLENLLRRAAKGEAFRHINRLVDVYNVVSLMHLVPVGGEDLDRIEGDLRLALAGEHEPPVRLLGESEARAPKPGEILYRDEAGAVCRRWNWKEADRTKLEESTSNAILVVEALPPVGRRELEGALGDLERLVGERCGGALSRGILDGERPGIDIGP